METDEPPLARCCKGDSMKKTESRKLMLAKETVRNLDGYLQEVMGGVASAVAIVSSDNRACTYSRQCQIEQYPVGNG
jgi:hypothetical protein